MRLPIVLCLALLALSSASCTMPDPASIAAANEPRLSAEGITALEIGDQLPALTAQAADSSEVNLTPGQGSGVLLLIFPAPHTPNSTANLLALSRDLARLQDAGFEVYGLSRSTTVELRRYAADFGFNVPLLADPDGSLCESLGALAPGGAFPQRTLIGTDDEGTILLYERRILPVPQILELLGVSPVTDEASSSS